MQCRLFYVQQPEFSPSQASFIMIKIQSVELIAPNLQLNLQALRPFLKIHKASQIKRRLDKIVLLRQKQAAALAQSLIPGEVSQIKKCNTKKLFKNLLTSLSDYWKDIIRYYLIHCMIYDIYTRKVEDKIQLLSKREIFYAVVDDPELLDLDCHFDNNLVKNFCNGLANFIKKFFRELDKAVSSIEPNLLKEVSKADCESADTCPPLRNTLHPGHFADEPETFCN